MAAILECKKLKKQYGNFTALNEIDLTLPEGKIVGLLGPNGSGKTTLIKLASGLLLPSSGEILIAGQKPGIDTKKLVAYLPERNYLTDSMKVSGAVDFMADFYSDFDKNKAYDLLDKLNIDPKKTLKSLSKGTKEKVQLILVMSRNARLYLLDEPIGGVDPAARDYILDTIISNYCENATVLISTHLIADVESVLDEYVFIQNGNILEHGSVERIKESGKTVDGLFREVFRC
ncbi:MAG: ABC transporter ATP-binding protein [Oscillospiraceae bacterium]|nr:ABC transporter ATP-binding protein [Oscillospiraceae bacterium]